MIGTGYSSAEVAELLGVAPSRIRSFVAAGFAQPVRSGRHFVFSFQDIVLLRTAKGLLDARIRPSRIKRALRRLRETLPDGQPLAGIAIHADGTRIVVRDGSQPFDPECGQTLFDFDVKELSAGVTPILERATKQSARETESAEEWFEVGARFEMTSSANAETAYRRAIELDPQHVDAHVNLGRLLHEDGKLGEAEEHYRKALEAAPDDHVAWFNLGVLLEGQGKRTPALSAYQNALAQDADSIETHLQIAKLFEQLGQRADAVRHLKIVRALSQ
ncbi:MAG: tetratricopeptide repeat protein [Blastocatellia bacterium]